MGFNGGWVLDNKGEVVRGDASVSGSVDHLSTPTLKTYIRRVW